MKILNALFIVLIVILVILFIALVLVNIFDKGESKEEGLKDITGAMQSFEVSNTYPQYAGIKTTEKYDDKFFEYLESIQEARDNTFMRGKVFLK